MRDGVSRMSLSQLDAGFATFAPATLPHMSPRYGGSAIRRPACASDSYFFLYFIDYCVLYSHILSVHICQCWERYIFQAIARRTSGVGTECSSSSTAYCATCQCLEKRYHCCYRSSNVVSRCVYVDCRSTSAQRVLS